jgi:hypothetical protein
LQKYLKALYGAVYAGLLSLDVAYADNAISKEEAVKVGIALLGAFGVIWAVPNKASDA